MAISLTVPDGRRLAADAVSRPTLAGGCTWMGPAVIDVSGEKLFLEVRSVTPYQLRAARGLLGWSQENLAHAAEVGLMTVRNFETGKANPRKASYNAMRRALESAGVVFIDGDEPGVKLRRTGDL